jgi:uncharacterized membrane protein
MQTTGNVSSSSWFKIKVSESVCYCLAYIILDFSLCYRQLLPFCMILLIIYLQIRR